MLELLRIEPTLQIIKLFMNSSSVARLYFGKNTEVMYSLRSCFHLKLSLMIKYLRNKTIYK